MKKIMFYLLLGYTFGICNTASAEIIQYYTLASGGGLAANDPLFTDQVQDVADEIDALGLAPVRVNVIVERIAGGASFDYGKIVYIPRVLQYSGEYGGTYTKMTMDVMAVFAHEYGHAVFGHFLEQKFPDYARLKRLKNEMSDIGLELLRTDLDANTRTAHENRISELRTATERNVDLIKIARQVSPYSELYSDALAVFIMHSKSAIYEALSYDEMHPHYQDYVATRDFARQHDAANWSYSDPHGMFGPLRSAIGASGCWPQNQSEQKLRLQQLQQVLMDQLEAKVAAGEMPGSRDNQALIEAFQSFCR